MRVTLRRNWLIVGYRHRFTQHDLILRRRSIRTSIAAARKAWRIRKRQIEARMGDVKPSKHKVNIGTVSPEKLIAAYLLMRKAMGGTLPIPAMEVEGWADDN